MSARIFVATKENIPRGSSTEEQRSQAAFTAKIRKAPGLLSSARVGSVFTARCGNAPWPVRLELSSSWPTPKSLCAGPLAIFILALSFALPALAIDKPELENRILALTTKFEALQHQPDKAIPAESLLKAQAIILIDRTKAGFIFAYQGGGGVALARDPKNGKWSPAAFLTASEASLGFQVGGEQTFYAILFMTTNATRLLTEANITFGGEARGTAGDSSEGVEGKISPTAKQVLVYTDRQGLYGGAAIKGGAITADDKANRIFYQQDLTLKDILFDRKVVATDAATRLAAKLSGPSKSSKP